MKSIAITEEAFVLACHPEFPLERILSGDAPEKFESLFIREREGVTLISGSNCSPDSRFLIIARSGDNSIFDGMSKFECSAAFERCVRIGLRSIDKQIALNPNWMPYRHDNRTSLFAHNNADSRILAEINFSGSGNTYVYDILPKSECQDLSICTPDPVPYQDTLSLVPDLFLLRPTAVEDGRAIELDHITSKSIAKGFAYDEWIPLLSSHQRQFLDNPIKGPVRVRGSAGTGKTLAMAMKALKIAKDTGSDQNRILFLTHSWAMASQVDEMIRRIGRDIPAASSIEVYPLLAMSGQRDYNAIGRRPLGTDSDEGKRKAIKIIEDLVKNFVSQDWIAFRSGCSDEFVKNIESEENSNARKNLVWDILLEFACVLAAQGLLNRAHDRERYLRIRRAGYMMPLTSITEKEVIFKLWSDFLLYLKSSGFISSDQIIGDYLNELQTFYWEAKRPTHGYDYIFVDEMHLFNAQERLVFHNLLADGDSSAKVIMALDPRQSPREVFAEISDGNDNKNRNIYERARLPNPEKVDFLDVYRYTIEIAALTKSVIDSVPALDMDDDWNIPSGGSVVGHGPVPRYYLEANQLAVFRRSIDLAQRLQSEARVRKGQIAILCMDYEKFNVYYKAAQGQYPNEVYIIKSRDDIERLRYMSRRIILSTPEYVAGLQFDTVIIADVNADLVPDASYKGHQERRFLSELYLGMSRAQHDLILVASRQSDGLTPYLRKQEHDGLLQIAV